MSTEDIYRLGMKDVILKNEIQWEGRIHSLRHFPASRMIDKNWNIKRPNNNLQLPLVRFIISKVYPQFLNQNLKHGVFRGVDLIVPR